jgi:broad specificity phosphatase PhoE
MRTLILAKHAMPELRPDVPAARWHLSTEGIAGAKRLAERLRAYEPNVVVSSTEPKALETAAIVSEALGVQLESPFGLHEHERPEPGLLEPAVFERRIAELFARPSELVFGAESASDALRRFATAVDRAVADNRGNVAVISHGTVISLFVAARAHEDGRRLWKVLGLPSYVVLELPKYRLTELVGSL